MKELPITGDDVENALHSVSENFTEAINRHGQLTEIKERLESLSPKKRFLRADFIRNDFLKIETEILRLKDISKPHYPQRNIFTGEPEGQEEAPLMNFTTHQHALLNYYLSQTRNFIDLLSNMIGNEILCSLESPMKDDLLQSQGGNDNSPADNLQPNESNRMVTETTSKGFQSAFNAIDQIRLDLEALKTEEILSYDNIDSVMSGNEKPHFITNNFNQQATALCLIWHEKGYFKTKSEKIAWTIFSRFFDALYRSEIVSLKPKKLSAACHENDEKIKSIKSDLSDILE